MELIIDIPEKEYELVRHGNKSYTTELALMNAVANGTPLPEHHGRIIDESQIKHIVCHTEQELYEDKICYVKATDAPTIIEGSESK